MAGRTGTARNDNLSGSNDDDVIVGDALNLGKGQKGGNDTIEGLGGDDFLYGDAGNQDDPFSEGVLEEATGGNDTLRGGDGDDVLQGDAAFLGVLGDGGNDKLFGDAGNDFLVGDAFEMGFLAGGGDDTLDGDDDLFGDSGADSRFFGSGNDKMTGGAGYDIFHLGRGKDQVKDFDKVRDSLEIGNLGLTFEDLDTDGSGTLTSDDRFVTAKGKTVKIDVGAAMGLQPKFDVTTIVVGKGIVLDANDFIDFT